MSADFEAILAQYLSLTHLIVIDAIKYVSASYSNHCPVFGLRQ